MHTKSGLRSPGAFGKSVTPRQSRLRAATLALAGILAPAAIGFAPVPAAADTVYTAVIDAGSSGTRISLYQVVPGPYPVIEEIAKHKGVAGDEGIDDFLNRLGGAEKNLGPDAVGTAVIGPLLDAVAPALRQRGVRDGDVVVDLLATAGMRSALKPIGTHEPSEIAAFYDGIRRFITARGFSAGDIRTVDGSAEEGLWTWIEVNNRYRDAFRSDKAPIGIVEVGGSSMQVSYPTSAAPDPARNIYAVTINGRTFSVFDRTYLGLGQDDARRAMRQETPPADGGARCFPTGMKPAQDSGDIIDGQRMRISGPAKFDAVTCIASYTGIIKARLSEDGDPGVAGSTGPFYGIASVRYAFEEIDAAGQIPSPAGLSGAIATKCAPAGAVGNFRIDKKFGQHACPSAAYIDALLYGPAGLFHGDPSLFKSTIADRVVVDGKPAGTISRTMGYLLQKYAR